MNNIQSNIDKWQLLTRKNGLNLDVFHHLEGIFFCPIKNSILPSGQLSKKQLWIITLHKSIYLHYVIC